MHFHVFCIWTNHKLGLNPSVSQATVLEGKTGLQMEESAELMYSRRAKRENTKKARWRRRRKGLKWPDWHAHTKWNDFYGDVWRKKSPLWWVLFLFSTKKERRREKVINFPSVQLERNLTAEKMSDFRGETHREKPKSHSLPQCQYARRNDRK